ncbi:MAG: hypothetical protein H0W82_03345 [Actinobacteria bacterium]|nr:hypothetical protein [Actinomycetota bacterium]
MTAGPGRSPHTAGTAEGAGGSLTIRSAIDEGTSVELWLPESAAATVGTS